MIPYMSNLKSTQMALKINRNEGVDLKSIHKFFKSKQVK